MADVPFLGCKISLISKCDIRYEGILYCVDAKESTIALSKVKSYGTETRGDPSCYVAPKNDVYDIIIFRASDVKDLRVDAPEPPGLSDPAIISAHHSYPGQSTSASSFSNTISNTTSTTNNATTTTGAPQTLTSNGSLNLSGPSNQQQPQHHQHKQQHQKPLLPFLPSGSNSSNNKEQPQLPTINYSSAVSNAQRRARPDQQQSQPQQQHQQTRDKRSDDANNKINKQPHEAAREFNNHRRGDDRRMDNNKRDLNDGGRRGDRIERRDRDDRRDGHREDGRRGGGERRDGGRPSESGRLNMRVSRGGYENNRNHVNPNMRYNNSNTNNYHNPRRGLNNRDNDSKGGGPPMYRRGGMMHGGRRARSNDRTGAPRVPRKTAPLKFEGEYDFDEANKLFLELDGKFKGLKIKGGASKGDEDKDGESSGDGVASKSPAGQSESGSGYDSEDQNNKDGDSKDGFGGSVSGDFYDRTKSFFDNISCEASERSQGKVNHDWRKERQMNTETFGASANYRRGGYRGRIYGANGYHRR